MQKPTSEQLVRRKIRNRRIVISFFLFLGAVVVLESPLTRVRSFHVAGNRTVLAAKILEDTSMHAGMSLWQVNPVAVEHEILVKEPLVQSVGVTTDTIRGIISLQVTEKHIVSIYELGGKFYNLLSDGMVYQQLATSGGLAFPLITAVGNPVPIVGQVMGFDVQQVCKQLSRMSNQNLSSISEIHVANPGTVEIDLDNHYVALCSVTQLAAALPNFRAAVQYFSTKGYQPGLIDLTGPPPYRYTPFSRPVTNQTSKRSG